LAANGAGALAQEHLVNCGTRRIRVKMRRYA
jgi:hypothetical protein